MSWGLKYFLSIFFILTGLSVMASVKCSEVHQAKTAPDTAIEVPQRLALVQVGYVKLLDSTARSLGRQWFVSRYSFDLNRWIFSDRMLEQTELTDLYRTKNYSAPMMNFTYDNFVRRGLRRTNIDRDSFLSILSQEDRTAPEDATTYFGFQIDHQIVATAKTTIVPPGYHLGLPLSKKLPKAAAYIQQHYPNQTLIEIGRLAKIKEIHIETIFSTIAHHMLQQEIRSGMVFGHAAPAQAAVYEKLGFKIILNENDLGPDQMVVAMTAEDFLRRFPPRGNQVVNPTESSFMDQIYHIPQVNPADQK
jgi:hypothetical protein